MSRIDINKTQPRRQKVESHKLVSILATKNEIDFFGVLQCFNVFGRNPSVAAAVGVAVAVVAAVVQLRQEDKSENCFFLSSSSTASKLPEHLDNVFT